MSLTELAIKNLKPGQKLYRVSDSGNLSLEITPKGSKLWRWRYYYQGKSQMLALGKYPDVSLATARKLRDEARGLLQAGKHPAREKKINKLRQGYEGELTFESIAREWHEKKFEVLDSRYKKHSLSRMEEYVFPEIGILPLKEITIPHIVRMIDKISAKGVTDIAKRMKQTVAQVFRYAAKRGLCEHNPASDLRDIFTIPKVKHHACVHPKQLPELLSAISKYHKGQTASFAIQLIALTTLRTKELIGGKWDEIDWDNQVWNIPKERMKMKKPHFVPLPRQAIKLLKELHLKTGHSDYIFYSSTSKTKHISNNAILATIRKLKYQNKMTGHGFRTLASTILNEKGYSPDVIEKQLAHEDQNKVRAAYNRAEYIEERKKMMQDYANILHDYQNKNINFNKLIISDNS